MESSGNSSSKKSRNARRVRGVLAVFSVIVLALAASPAALAKERGRPNAPGVQQANLDQFLHILRSQLRCVSWSD